jgi:flagellar protein FliO/FliZ
MDSLATLGRVLLSLAFVLGLMWLIARKVRKGAGGGGRDGKLIEVLSRQQLSRSASVAVIRVLDQALIVGVTEGQVSVLGESDLQAAQAGAQPSSPARTVRAVRPQTADDAHRGPIAGSALSPATWKQTVESLRDLTARRT